MKRFSVLLCLALSLVIASALTQPVAVSASALSDVTGGVVCRQVCCAEWYVWVVRFPSTPQYLGYEYDELEAPPYNWTHVNNMGTPAESDGWVSYWTSGGAVDHFGCMANNQPYMTWAPASYLFTPKDGPNYTDTDTYCVP